MQTNVTTWGVPHPKLLELYSGVNAKNSLDPKTSQQGPDGSHDTFRASSLTPPQAPTIGTAIPSTILTDTLEFSRTKYPIAPRPTAGIDKKQLCKSLKKMTIGALAGGATLGGSVLVCAMGMVVSHTDGQENAKFGWGGLALGAAAGTTAALCGTSPLISLALAGAVTQSVMSLADWFDLR